MNLEMFLLVYTEVFSKALSLKIILSLKIHYITLQNYLQNANVIKLVTSR